VYSRTSGRDTPTYTGMWARSANSQSAHAFRANCSGSGWFPYTIVMPNMSNYGMRMGAQERPDVEEANGGGWGGGDGQVSGQSIRQPTAMDRQTSKARTRTSGEANASMSARASSIPGSQSMITFRFGEELMVRRALRVGMCILVWCRVCVLY
jgi:hypothetical protein